MKRDKKEGVSAIGFGENHNAGLFSLRDSYGTTTGERMS
jgi:hypothetical protein